MRSVRAFPLLGLLLFSMTAGCAPRFASAGLGNYSAYQPYAIMRAATVELELAAPAYVAIIGVIVPGPGYAERPVVFRPIYPRNETDQLQFEAGKHRLVPRRLTLRDPRNCRSDEKPSLGGCRRPYYQYTGTSDADAVRIYQSDPDHYLVIASEEYIDAYELADDLYDMAFERLDLARMLRGRRAEQGAAELERALLDRPGSSMWAAFYVVTN